MEPDWFRMGQVPENCFHVPLNWGLIALEITKKRQKWRGEKQHQRNEKPRADQIVEVSNNRREKAGGVGGMSCCSLADPIFGICRCHAVAMWLKQPLQIRVFCSPKVPNCSLASLVIV